MNKTFEPKRSAASWLVDLAKGRYGEYALSVLAALLGVACSLAPYFIIIQIITALVDGTAELSQCLTLCAWMAGCWVLRYVLHSVSTSLSHHATFHVLANTRTRLLDKLATLPLGAVLDRSSGSYKNIIVERVDSSQANRRVIESLIKAGAFDSTGYPRRQMMHFVDKNNPENIIDAAVKRQKDRASGQTSFFDMFGDVEGSGFEVSVPDPDGQEWDRHLKLSQEKEVLGIYVSDHPLRPFEYALSKARDFSFSQIDTGYEVQNPTGGTINQEIPEGKALWWAGMVSSVSKRVTKNGDPMGIVQLEDMEGEATVVVFPKTYKEAEGYLYGEVDPETGAQLSDAFVRIKGKLERSDRGDQIIAQEIVPLELSEEKNKPKVFEVMVPNSRFSQGNMARLATVLTTNPGGDRVEIFIEQVDGRVLRAEVPAKVNARSIPLLAEAKAIVGNQGRVTVI